MEHQTHSIGHETSDANVRGIVYTGTGLAVVIVLAGLIGYALFEFLVRHPLTGFTSPMSDSGAQRFPPAPRIEDRPAAELENLRKQDEQNLTTYGWVDKNSGVVRIPVDRAIELQLQRGFPTRKERGK